MSSIELLNGSATMTPRADYLLVVEHGTLATSGEATRYTSELEQAAERFLMKRLLVDARSETTEVDAKGDARSAMWRWIRTQRVFEMIGFILVDEMTIARVNMTALSERLPVRAFASVSDGHRWLAKVRRSSTGMPAVVGSAPPLSARKSMTDIPAQSPARESSTRNLRPQLSSTQEVPAVQPPESTRAVSGETARTTVKVPALDAITAEQKLRSR